MTGGMVSSTVLTLMVIPASLPLSMLRAPSMPLSLLHMWIVMANRAIEPRS